MINTRRTLLRRVGVATETEIDAFDQAKVVIAQLVPGTLLERSHADEMADVDVTSAQTWLAGLSRTVKSGLALWIRSQLVGRARIQDLYANRIVPHGRRVSTTRSDVGNRTRPDEDAVDRSTIVATRLMQFHVLRDILERLQAYPVLADVVKVFLNFQHPSLLVSITDTLHHHLDIFTVLGVSQPAYEVLLERYKLLRAHKRLEGPFIYALAELALNIPGAQAVGRQLCSDLYEHEHRAALAADSPVADDTQDDRDQSDPEFFHDVDRLLSGGSTIDPTTLARLFRKIIVRIESGWGRVPAEEEIDFCHLMVKLRTLEAKGFGELMHRWVSDLLKGPSSSSSSSSSVALPHLGPLVTSGTLPLTTVVSCSADVLQNLGETERPKGRAIALDTLDFLTSDGVPLPRCSEQVGGGDGGAVVPERSSTLSLKLIFDHRIAIASGVTKPSSWNSMPPDGSASCVVRSNGMFPKSPSTSRRISATSYHVERSAWESAR